MDAVNNNGLLHNQYTSSEIGHALVEQYFDVLDRFPDQAWRFYAKRGIYQTIYPDGTTAVARDWKEQSNILMSPAPDGFETILIESVESAMCGSMDRILVVATGPRFTQSFFIENRPEERRTYAIVASVTRFSRAENVVDLPSVDATAGQLIPVLATEVPIIESSADGQSVDATADRLTSVSATEVPIIESSVDGQSVDATADRLTSVLATEVPIIESSEDGQSVDNAVVRLPSVLAKKPKMTNTKNRVRFAEDIASTVVFDKNLPPTSISADSRYPNADGQRYASTKLFVGCVPKSVKSQELTNLFAEFGSVHYVQVKGSRNNRRGFSSQFNYAFVDFDCPSSVDKALSHGPIRINGHVLKVNRKIASGERRF